MTRRRVIRARRRAGRDATLRGAEAAFWFVLVLAIGVGGGRAVAGLPVLASALLPSGLLAAEAQGERPSNDVTLPVRMNANPSVFAPAVLLPVVSHDFPAWFFDRAAASGSEAAAPRRAAIAIVIDDLGADAAATRRAIALPAAVSMSFLPYPDATPALASEATRAGHEILVHVPMEPDGAENTGPNALLTGLDAGEIARRLDWALARVPGFNGINNHMGSRFTSDRAALVPVMEDLAGRHVFFLDSRTTPDTVVVPLARAFGVASAGRDVFLDDEQSAGAVGQQLAELERRAREEGVAIAIGHPHDVTLAALAVWAAHANANGFDLVPVSVAIRRKTETEVLAVLRK